MVVTTLQIQIAIDSDSSPNNLPSIDVIIQKSSEVPNDKRCFALVDESSGVYIAWVKRGRSIGMGEARTQHRVAQLFNGNPGAAVRAPYVYIAFEWDYMGFIVMEYIPGTTCTDADVQAVAAAVTSLINVQGTMLGPVGGGQIKHSFFQDWESSVWYKSVEDLENHINGVSTFFGSSPSLRFRWVVMITLDTDLGMHRES